MMTDLDAKVAAAAERHGLSAGAGRALFDALVSGGGTMAQFTHPELGGMGQWSGGMLQIGDMFNDALKTKVGAFLREMSESASGAEAAAETSRPLGAEPPPQSDRWWPASLGEPASAGAQNDMGYAFFPAKRRLAVSRGGRVTLYDTADHRLSGFSQQRPGAGALSFSGQDGPVQLDSLRSVEE